MASRKQKVQTRNIPRPRPAGVDLPTPAAPPKPKDDVDQFFASASFANAGRVREGVQGVVPRPKRNNREWNLKHKQGRVYSVSGLRTDVGKWVADTAARLGVRTGEIAEASIHYSVELIESGRLRLVTYLNARSGRHTLYPDVKPWRKKVVSWWPFDQELKEMIALTCRDQDITQGEFVTLLLEKAREDHERGLLKFIAPKEGVDPDGVLRISKS
jgi:hypothetical protein